MNVMNAAHMLAGPVANIPVATSLVATSLADMDQLLAARLAQADLRLAAHLIAFAIGVASA